MLISNALMQMSPWRRRLTVTLIVLALLDITWGQVGCDCESTRQRQNIMSQR